MKVLNCAPGDLAITVGSNLPENCGNIVRVISAVGFESWPSSPELLYTWNVEIATPEGLLHYLYANGQVRTAKSGPVPDKNLRRLTPPKDYLLEEFSDSEQLQLNLYEVDMEQSESNV